MHSLRQIVNMVSKWWCLDYVFIKTKFKSHSFQVMAVQKYQNCHWQETVNIIVNKFISGYGSKKNILKSIKM